MLDTASAADDAGLAAMMLRSRAGDAAAFAALLRWAAMRVDAALEAAGVEPRRRDGLVGAVLRRIERARACFQAGSPVQEWVDDLTQLELRLSLGRPRH
jgi:hypothetical protein